MFLCLTIDEVFSLLGEFPRDVIFLHLRNDFGIKREEILNRLKDFSELLEKIFGAGTKFLEVNFMRQLHKKSKGTKEWAVSKRIVSNLTLQSYVKLKRQSIQNRIEVCEMEVLMDKTKQIKA